MAKVVAFLLLTVSQQVAALRVSDAPVRTDPPLQGADDKMRFWKLHKGKVPESIPGSSAFSTWSDLIERTGDLDDETDILQAQKSRMISTAELEEEKRRVMNGEAGRSRSHPLGSAATKNCGASPALHLDYDGDGRIHYEDTTSTYPTTVDIPLQPKEQLFSPSPDLLSAFRDKWIYVHGDSTSRQQCQHFVGALLNIRIEFDEFKDCMRYGSRCPDVDMQNHAEQPLDWDFLYTGSKYHAGGNEHTLTMYVRRLNTTFTCDWKMNSFRRYDRWLLKKRFHLEAPDLYIVSAGLHECAWPASLEMGGAYHALQVETFFEYLSAFLPAKTNIVWLSAQLSIKTNPENQVCLNTVNEAARQSAAKHDVAFVDRENFTTEIVGLVYNHPKIRCHITDDGIHLKMAFTEITYHYLSEASRCLLTS
jgi:hypothetical protein